MIQRKYVDFPNHSLDLANTLDGLNSEPDKRRVYRRESQIIYLNMIIEREFSNFILLPMWEPRCRGKQVAGFDNSVERRGWPAEIVIACSSSRASVAFNR